ncbi:MAG: hypothetical protein ACREMA_09730, partial [Longimicrobiales bacterium]
CYTDPYGYSYTDSMSFSNDSMTTYNDGWWRRLRRRVFGGDTLSVDTQPDSTADSVIRDTTGPRLLGRPVNQDTQLQRIGTDSALRKRMESMRRPPIDSIRRIRPDTLRKN